MKRLTKSFFDDDTVSVAKNLLGCYVETEVDGKRCVGKIVETEAYLFDDPATHSFKGKTSRNAMMFEEAGRVYVYFIYGMYYCVNIVTNKKHVGEAVLIRALEPVEGIGIMKKRRKKDKEKDLCSGPAKLVISMGITKSHNGESIFDKHSPIKVFGKDKTEVFKIVATTRIGIVEENAKPHRFYIKGNEFISKS